jgi:hypothetical protein
MVDYVYNSETIISGRNQYTLSSAYKLISLAGDMPINIIDISVFWYDSDFVLHPIDMNKGETLSMRLVFIRKN